MNLAEELKQIALENSHHFDDKAIDHLKESIFASARYGNFKCCFNANVKDYDSIFYNCDIDYIVKELTSLGLKINFKQKILYVSWE